MFTRATGLHILDLIFIALGCILIILISIVLVCLYCNLTKDTWYNLFHSERPEDLINNIINWLIMNVSIVFGIALVVAMVFILFGK